MFVFRKVQTSVRSACGDVKLPWQLTTNRKQNVQHANTVYKISRISIHPLYVMCFLFPGVMGVPIFSKTKWNFYFVTINHKSTGEQVFTRNCVSPNVKINRCISGTLSSKTYWVSKGSVFLNMFRYQAFDMCQS